MDRECDELDRGKYRRRWYKANRSQTNREQCWRRSSDKWLEHPWVRSKSIPKSAWLCPFRDCKAVDDEMADITPCNLNLSPVAAGCSGVPEAVTIIGALCWVCSEFSPQSTQELSPPLETLFSPEKLDPDTHVTLWWTWSAWFRDWWTLKPCMK